MAFCVAVAAGVPARRVASGLIVTCLFLLPGAAGASGVPDGSERAATVPDAVGHRLLVHDAGTLLEPPLPPSPGAPLPPMHLRAHVDGDDVVLTWEAPLAGTPLAYRVYRLGLANGGTLNGTLADGGAVLDDALTDSGALLYGALSLRAAAQSALLQSPQEVPAHTTTYRDTQADPQNEQYVYVVTAVHPSPAAGGGLLQTSPPAAPSPSGAGTRSHDDGEQESPSNPAYTYNPTGSCQWFENNVPDEPYFDVNWQCIPSVVGP